MSSCPPRVAARDKLWRASYLLFNAWDTRLRGCDTTMNLSKVISSSIQTLIKHSIDNPELDARLLICHALGIDRAQLISQSERLLTPDEIVNIESLMERRIAHESVARIIGQREFWSLPFGLNEATLEPRPDSETLVEVTLKVLHGRHSGENRNPAALSERKDCTFNQRSYNTNSHNLLTDSLDPGFRGDDAKKQISNYRILDIGTGTGCLLLSLLHELPHATGVGLDISPRAVEQAQNNALALGLTERADFRVNNWLDGLAEKFDIILSNPPYIRSAVIPTLAPEVKKYDPLRALDGGSDGLAPYRILIPQLPQHLNSHGFAVFEIGYDQAEQVSTLFTQAGFRHVALHKDLGGNPRCITASID